MGSIEQSDSIEESILKSEAPKAPEESSSTDECDSLVPIVSMLSAELAPGCDEQRAPINETVSVLEAPKENPETSSFEECGSLVIEVPTLESALGPLRESEENVEGSVCEQQSCLVMNTPVGSGEALVDECVVTDQDAVADTSYRAETENKAAAIDGLGALESDPEYDKLSEVECGVNQICLNEINLNNEAIVSDLKPVASSVEDLRFSGIDCLSNTLGESQMASRGRSFSSAATGVEEDGLFFPYNNINLSAEGNMKSALDLNDAIKTLHVDPHDTSSLPDSSTEWCKKTSSGHIDVPLLEINSEISEKDHYVLGDQCFPGQDRVLSVGHAYALKRSTLFPEHVVENLSNSVKQTVSLQCCDPEMVVGSGSPSDLFREETFKGILLDNNSVAIADITCFSERGNAYIGDAEAMESNEDLSSLRRSSREKKSQKASNRKYTKKGSKKALDRTMDLLSAAVRSKRSCLNRSARVSGWGLVESLSKYIKLNTGAVDPRSGIIKSGGKSRKKEKVRVDASSHGLNSKSRNHASSGQVSLKLKLVKKGKSAIESSPLIGTNIQVKSFIGSDDNQMHLSKCIKDVIEGSSIKPLEYISDIKLEKSATMLENYGVAANSVDEVSEVTLIPGKGSSIGGSNLSDKEVQRSGGSADDRHLNSGTSPDSEVIHVPNSQRALKELEVHHNGGMGSLNSTQAPAENGPPAIPKMRRKKEKEEQICQLGDSDVQNRLLSSSGIDKAEIPENYGENGTKSDMDARLDISTKLLPSSSKGNRKSKGLKSKEKTKVKSKPVSAPRLKMDISRKAKGDKWKLIGKYSISENGISDFAHRKEDDCEAAGKHVMHDSGNKTIITMNGVAYEEVTSLPAIPGSALQQRTQLRTAWVCCDDCLKWRCIPANLADIIDETNCKWTCKDNQDKAFADCSVPQEKSNAEINAELNISEDEDGSGVHLSGKYYSTKHSAAPQQSSWMLIKSNIFLHRSRNSQTLDEIMVCHCKSSRDGKLGCGDECLNRMLNIECVQGTCPCGDVCSNQQFQRQSYANLKWFRSGKKGYGLQVLEDITEGKFLIEYVGEVLDLPTYEARQRVYASKGHKHFYFMTLNGNEVIDACAKGNLGRFINHSCDPNCRTEKWMVNGEICIGLFAVRDIKKGEELTFDYNYVRVFGAAAKKCYCGAPQCRGYIGGDRLDNEVVVQSDSDEEFPEPVVLYENGEIADDINMMSESSSLYVMKEKKDGSLLQNDADMLPDGKDITHKWEDSLTSVGGKLRSIAEDTVHSSVFELENVDKSRLNVQQESPTNRISVSMTSPKRSDSSSLNVLYPESLNESVDAEFNRSATEITDGKAVQSKGRPRMKISRPSKSGKSKEFIECGSGATIDKAMVMSKKSQPTPTKLKKLVESSAKHHFETVEEKLNELLDDAGGICKRKDAFKGYLKLLVLTAASGDCNHHETIQSNKDLSMILDAILKTKSRTVLTDILNKNGLQMLHSMVKKCRGNFNMIPILRKLLKVFEFLAERKILNLEHINGDPPRPGVERFRDSILNLTEHQDRKVHQIARNFRDRWIPRPVKKFNCMERAPNGSRFGVSHHHRSDHADRPSESTYVMKRSLSPGHLIDSDMLEGPSHIGECLTNTRVSGKRKSRWDQSPEAVPHGIKVQKTADDLHTFSEGTHHFKNDEEVQEIEEDAPPGFSCPAFGAPHPSNGSSSPVIPIPQQYPGPSEVPLGFAQERFNSGLPVAYGIPFNYVQEFGTPQATRADHWVIAPGMPFRPFPPLPLSPREGRREAPSAFTGYLAAPNTDQGCPGSSSARFPNTISTVNTHLQHDRGGPCNVERRPFKQRRNGFGKPPWGFNRNGYGPGRNFPRRPSGVAMGTTVNDPENVNNYGV